MTATGQAIGVRRAAGVAALVLAWFGATAWMRPLMLPDEGRYVGVAWEMMRSGDWLTPTLDGLPFFHKPPLFYWISAGAMQLFGPHAWAARAASVLGASLGAFALWLFVRRWSGVRAARLTLIALLVQPLFYVGGQFANLDMLVAGCISATILLLAQAVLRIERAEPHRAALAGAWAMAACGVLAKGLIGFVIPGLVVTVWLLMRRRGRTVFTLLWWPGLLLFLVLAAPWFIGMQARYPAFLDYFFVVQQFQRFSQGGFNNVQPFWFYAAVLLLFALPWWPWIARRVRREPLDASTAPSLRLLWWAWAGVVLVFFSIPQSKLIGYVLPAVPPLAALAAEGYLRAGVPSLRGRRLWVAGVALLGVLSVGAVVALTLRPTNSLRDLAMVLAQQRVRHEPVFMLGHYAYDLPFQARLEAPVQVVDDWQRADIRQHDNWRKELADAGQFAPARAALTLLLPAALPATLCAAPVSWVIGPESALAAHPYLQAAEVAARLREMRLWRVDTRTAAMVNALRCEGTPSAG